MMLLSVLVLLHSSMWEYVMSLIVCSYQHCDFVFLSTGYMIHYKYVKDDTRVRDVAKVMKKQFPSQRDKYINKNVVCFSVRDIYGRASSRCEEV